MEESNIGFNGELEDIFRQQEALHKLEENQYWEQIRVQAAIAAMQGILANTCITRWNDNYTVRSEFLGAQKVSTRAINYADALIEELKKEK